MPSMSPAASRLRRESRTPRKSRPSSEQCRMKTVELPDERGHFGQYGGVLLPGTRMNAHDEPRRADEGCPQAPEVIHLIERELKPKACRPASNYPDRRPADASRDWVTNVSNIFSIIGTIASQHPYPMMVRDFQAVIGTECIRQMPEICGRQPDAVIACVGGGSNAMGIFCPYIPHEAVKLVS